MSTKYPGGIITKSPATPTGPFETGTAPGIWTLTQQAGYKQQGVWPTAGLTANYIEDVFSTYLYTGTGVTQTITNNIDLSTKGGLVWTKDRTSAYNNALSDTARGVANRISSDLDIAQNTNGGLSSVSTTGYVIGTHPLVNNVSDNYVSWTFRKQPKFFDVVTYTGTGSNTTITHALGSVPACIIVKRTDTTADWAVYHRSLANTQYLVLNTTAAAATGATWWNSTTPTSSVFSLGTDASVNASGGTYVAYIFAHDAGGFGLTGTDNVISCGTFTSDSGGNATVSLGYEPQFVIMKSTSGVQDWVTLDVARGWSQSSGNYLRPNLSNSENATSGLGFPTATGFREEGLGQSGSTYIYIAIRRGPMKVPTTGTSVFIPVSQTGGGTVTTNFPVDLSISTARPADSNRSVMDRLRGSSTTKYRSLNTNDTAAEDVGTGGGLGFDNNTGYVDAWNGPTYTTIYWNFRRAPSCMDVVCYSGDGVAGRSVPHNLAAVPELMIVKGRNIARGWFVYSAALGGTKYLRGNTTDAVSASNGPWNNTTQTSSTVFVLGADFDVNQTTYTYVNYLFATCAGVSKVGSYTGTGTTQTINCGFTGGARFVLIKRTDSTGDWYVWDSARGIVAGNDPYLFLNSTAVEVTNTDYVDTYSAGFEISSTAPAAINANGGSFIFLAIA